MKQWTRKQIMKGLKKKIPEINFMLSENSLPEKGEYGLIKVIGTGSTKGFQHLIMKPKNMAIFHCLK